MIVAHDFDVRLVDWDEFDGSVWPYLGAINHLPALAQWRVLSRLAALSLAHASDMSEAQMRLWERGRRTDEYMAANRPTFVRAPRWTAPIVEDGSLLSLDDDVLLAAEALRHLELTSTNYMVAVRAFLTGEPSPRNGGWRKT